MVLVKKIVLDIQSEVLTAMVIKSNITLCSPLRVIAATCFHAGFLLGLFFNPEESIPKNIKLLVFFTHKILKTILIWSIILVTAKLIKMYV
jgi:hypothetical protein